MRIVDTKGQQCPAPLIATKRALRETESGKSFQLLTDNRTSLENISRFLKDNRIDFTVYEKDGTWTLKITKGESGEPLTNAEEYCATSGPHFSKGDFVVAFTSDKMGEGDEELGHLLILNFVKAIKDLDVLPRTILFYNNGVKLGITDSPVREYLNELEKMGVGLFFCTTCIKHYSLEEKIGIGTQSNMFEITRIMASATNIIKP